MIRQTARQYAIDPRLALAIALAESNLDPGTVSPRNAQGVMQLIPATQERFGVTRPFDPEHNIPRRAGLSQVVEQALCRRWAAD